MSAPDKQELWLVRKTEDGYEAHKLENPGTFLTVPEKPSAWKPFNPKQKAEKEG